MAYRARDVRGQRGRPRRRVPRGLRASWRASGSCRGGYHHPGLVLAGRADGEAGRRQGDTLLGWAATGSYDNTRFALARESRPFWSHREEGLAMSTVV